MAQSYERNVEPAGYKITEFSYMGPAAEDQYDFDKPIGIADMIQFDIESDDESNEYFQGAACSYYHAGVLHYSKDDTWWVYLEWGRVNNSTYSWKVSRSKATFELSDTSDFMFRICDDEDDARAYFKKKCDEKNTKRIQKKKVGGVHIWSPKGEKRAYTVQNLSQRMRGLPDAYTKTALQVVKGKRSKDPLDQFAYDMSGGSVQYAQKLIENGGSIPTLKGIDFVRNELIPAAMRLINKITPPKSKKLTKRQLTSALKKQLNDNDLIELSEYAATFVPRPIPLNISKNDRKKIIVLTQDNISTLQNDLDVFENLLSNTTTASLDPHDVFGADITWLDPKTQLWKWLEQTLSQMTNNRHFRAGMKIHNIFEVSRPTWDKKFISSVKKVAKARKGKFSATASHVQ